MRKQSIIIPETSLTIKYVNDVCEICKDLFYYTKIDYFCYSRFYKKNNRVLYLVSNGGWHQYFHKQGLYPFVDELSSGVYLAIDFLPESLQYAKSYFGRESFIALITDHKDYKEIFGFDSSSKNITSFYINNIDLLFAFKLYFQEKAEKLIKNVEKSPVIFPSPHYENKFKQLIDFSKRENFIDMDIFREKLCLKHYSLQHKGRIVKLSHRELSCLSLVTTGRTAKEIAQLLGVSCRTIESHIEHTKCKIGVTTKNHLIEFFEENALFYIKKMFK